MIGQRSAIASGTIELQIDRNTASSSDRIKSAAELWTIIANERFAKFAGCVVYCYFSGDSFVQPQNHIGNHTAFLNVFAGFILSTKSIANINKIANPKPNAKKTHGL